jgi:hypothetical protein
MANYIKGSVGTRKSTLSLTLDGEKAGGKIIAQKTFDDAANKFSKFRAVLYFRSMPKAIEDKAHWSLTLAGAIKVTPPGGGIANGFCGLTTVVTVTSGLYRYANPFAPGQYNYFRDMTVTTTNPNGASILSITLGPLADVGESDLGGGASTRTAEDREIWYEDTPGHYVNTHRPCSELPPGGGGVPRQTTEGFNYIAVEVFSARFAKVLPLGQWTVNTEANKTGNDLITPRLEQGPRWHLDIGQRNIGSASEAKYDDLDNGEYTFRNGEFQFQNLPKPDPRKLFTTSGLFPLLPLTVKYKFTTAVIKPYTEYTAAISGDGYPAGQRPPIDQAF